MRLSSLQIVVALLEPLQEGGALTVAASKALEELIIKGRSLLQAKLKGLPPLPQSIQVTTDRPGMDWNTTFCSSRWGSRAGASSCVSRGTC